jgi:thiamine monophosphate synthase
MGRKPEDYARLLASALCKLHAAESRGASPLISEDSVRIIRDTIAVAMEDARKIHIEQEHAAMRERREYVHLHS